MLSVRERAGCIGATNVPYVLSRAVRYRTNPSYRRNEVSCYALNAVVRGRIGSSCPLLLLRPTFTPAATLAHLRVVHFSSRCAHAPEDVVASLFRVRYRPPCPANPRLACGVRTTPLGIPLPVRAYTRERSERLISTVKERRGRGGRFYPRGTLATVELACRGRVTAWDPKSSSTQHLYYTTFPLKMQGLILSFFTPFLLVF